MITFVGELEGGYMRYARGSTILPCSVDSVRNIGSRARGSLLPSANTFLIKEIVNDRLVTEYSMGRQMGSIGWVS
jgi:hypothetical protein